MNPMQDLKERLSVLNSVLPEGCEVVFLGFPTYLNVGDLLIEQGTERFFQSRRCRVRGRYSDKYCWQLLQRGKMPRIGGGTVLVLQGGGNFGDLYGMHQPTREAIVRNYPRNRIVLLPQTAFFKRAEPAGVCGCLPTAPGPPSLCTGSSFSRGAPEFFGKRPALS
jgi:pyruvyl transferase EpsO